MKFNECSLKITKWKMVLFRAALLIRACYSSCADLQ